MKPLGTSDLGISPAEFWRRYGPLIEQKLEGIRHRWETTGDVNAVFEALFLGRLFDACKRPRPAWLRKARLVADGHRIDLIDWKHRRHHRDLGIWPGPDSPRDRVRDLAGKILRQRDHPLTRAAMELELKQIDFATALIRDLRLQNSRGEPPSSRVVADYFRDLWRKYIVTPRSRQRRR
jgi:hypothetical protein